MNTHHSPSRRAGDARIVDRAQRQVQGFFDELKNGIRNYRTVSSLDTQVAQEYRGRCILELLQNAHDALANAASDHPQRISFVLNTSPEPVLLIGNSGRPFRHEDFEGICELGQSPKDPNKNVGNKGLGFRSVLEVSTCPQIWSTTPKGSDTSFVFRFDTSVSEQMATAAREIELHGLSATSPFDPERPLVDWSPEQLERYRKRLSNARLDGADEARKFLSPYMLPLTINGVLPQVEKLLHEGHVTVIRLCLDGGRGGTCKEAVQSVKDQLQKLDAKSAIFLPHLERLVERLVIDIDIDGERRVMEREIGSAAKLPGRQQTQHQRLLVGHSGPTTDNHTTRQFQVWTRNIGGDDQPDEAERIRAAVERLPNRWPEVRQVTIGVAVEEAPKPDEQGVFVIFLPTETTTGMGTHINAPFYGSLDRRHINFEDPYNKLLMENVLDLCIDVAMWLISGETAGWRARAVIDVLSSTTTVDGQDWRIMDHVLERASKRGHTLHDQVLILCDDGWRLSNEARVMPSLQVDNPVSATCWREHANFAVVSAELDGRLDAVKELLKALDGSESPTNQEWQKTIERMAAHVQNHSIDATWNDFLTSLVSILPADLKSEPRLGDPDPLADARFLPTQDGRLLSASESTKLFFRPIQGVEDVAEFAEEVPDALKPRIAFLHRDIRTHEEGPQGRRNTEVQKFLDRRFVHPFGRKQLLETILDALPELPVLHDGPEADSCSQLFAWAMKLLGDEGLESSLDLIKRLPVACHGGWFPMSDATFGPGWPDRLGDLVWSLANELPEEAAERLRGTALLPPDDARWRVSVKNRGELFARAGVVDGLRLQPVPEVSFQMSGNGNHRLPSTPPINTPQKAWNDWRDAVREKAKPYHSGWFKYELSDVLMLPEIHYMTGLSSSGRQTLSCLVLASLEHWPKWESAVIKKTCGYSWSTCVTSPLKYWLMTLSWFNDGTDVEQPLGQRWLVPESLLRGQQWRYSHLNPLSLDIARRLNSEPTLKDSLMRLGLNVYPTEEDRTGPDLLDALATAWATRRVPTERFDVFLGQVRDAWQHLDSDKGLPAKFLLRTGRRTFSTRDGSDLVDVYLPDDRDRTRALQEHGKHILEMRPPDARRKADALATTNIKRASSLEERFLIDGTPWTEAVDGIPPLDETKCAAWLPITLLTIAAYGGTSPTGVTTETWRETADRLRRAHVLECETIVTQLVDDDQPVASSEPEAQWLPGNVLAIRREVGLSYEKLAPAAQALLDRQDLLKDLRLVLGTLAGQEAPTSKQIEEALERAEIDTQAFADVRHLWAGNTSLLVDRIRPVLALLGITDGFDAAAADTERLREWLSSNLSRWSAEDLLSKARHSHDDHAMGLATWRALGDIAQLPAWNEALASLGDRYEAVKNRHVDEQTQAHLEAATPLLRGLARHIAIKTGDSGLFFMLEDIRQKFKGGQDWATRWWEVPFGAVINGLHAGYVEIPTVKPHLEVLEEVTTIEDLRTKLQRWGISANPDPYETAAANKRELEEVLRQVHDLRRAWMEPRLAGPIIPDSEPQAEIDSRAYLRRWSDTELLERALDIIDDVEFSELCRGCASIDEIRKCIGVDQKAIDAQREARVRRAREKERKRRTFEVAGAPFEVGTMNYRELFERIDKLAAPEGPRASKDMFTPLAKIPLTDIRSGKGNLGEGGKKHGKTSQLRLSAEHSELVGAVGEMHAYRFLRAEFGSDIVNRNAWVSELRLMVLPPVTGESNITTSDSLGFDFRLRDHEKNLWHVEVKATIGDDTQFDLGISEVQAATRLARKRGERWRILRVRNALSDQPEFDWLPNPFEEDSRNYFRIQEGGLRVSYTCKKT